MGASIHNAYLRLILAGAERLGLNRADLLQQARLDPVLVDDDHARTPLEATRRLWRVLVTQTGDEAVGLRLARAAQSASAGALEYAARNAATIGDLLGTIAQYARLLNTGAVIAIEAQPHQVVMSYQVLERHDVHHAATDFPIAYLLKRTRDLSGRNLTPHRVCLPQARPTKTAPYTAVFGDHIDWGGASILVCFTPQQWATPVLSPDSELARVMRGVVEQQIADLPKIDDICSQIRVELLRSCEGTAPNLAAMARRLGLSARTVQRRLSEAGTTYRALSTQVRMAFAADLLRAGDLPLAEVAYVVGFSEPSTFHRAFRRAYGVTPTEYRTTETA